MSSIKHDWFQEKLAQVCDGCPGESFEVAMEHLRAGRYGCRLITDGETPIGFATFSFGNGLLKVHHVFAEPGHWDVLPRLIEDGKSLMLKLGGDRMEVMTERPDVLLRRISKFGFKKVPYTTLRLGGE